MDYARTGDMIRRLRRERGMTQRELAERLQITDKAVSRWERGVGCPDVSLLEELSRALGADLSALLTGNLPEEDISGGNMKKATYYVCPNCGGITVTTGAGELSCCGRKLAALTLQKAEEEDKLQIEKVEGEWFITSRHPMTKAHHIAFVAFAAGDRVQLIRQYPEWDLQLRLQERCRGTLLWYCTQHGLFYQFL